MIGDVIGEDELWACTTCWSCQEQCPVQNEHVNKVIDMRRSLVLDLGEFPQEAQLACRNVEKNGNPWGVGAQNARRLGQGPGRPRRPKPARPSSTSTGSAAPAPSTTAPVKVSKALVALLQEAEVSFAILGPDETCCGDPMRRIGNEYLFQIAGRRRTSRR